MTHFLSFQHIQPSQFRTPGRKMGKRAKSAAVKNPYLSSTQYSKYINESFKRTSFSRYPLFKVSRFSRYPIFKIWLFIHPAKTENGAIKKVLSSAYDTRQICANNGAPVRARTWKNLHNISRQDFCSEGQDMLLEGAIFLYLTRWSALHANHLDAFSQTKASSVDGSRLTANHLEMLLWSVIAHVKIHFNIVEGGHCEIMPVTGNQYSVKHWFKRPPI